MANEYKSLNAVYVDDLDDLLDSVGLLQDFKAEKLKCKFCRDVVSEKNIYSLISDSGQYKLVCSRAQCVAALMEFVTERATKEVSDE